MLNDGTAPPWALVDAEKAYEDGIGVYWLPSREDRERLAPGQHAKVIFQPEGHTCTESMWVQITDRLPGNRYRGELDNDPKIVSARCGERIEFSPTHIVDFITPDGQRASDVAADVLRCDTHGLSESTFVCEHIAGHRGSVGFNTAIDAEQRRPDAWCDACDKLLDGVAGWDEVPLEKHPSVKLLCGECYDLAKRRHEKHQ